MRVMDFVRKQIDMPSYRVPKSLHGSFFYHFQLHNVDQNGLGFANNEFFDKKIGAPTNFNHY